MVTEESSKTDKLESEFVRNKQKLEFGPEWVWEFEGLVQENGVQYKLGPSLLTKKLKTNAY